MTSAAIKVTPAIGRSSPSTTIKTSNPAAIRLSEGIGGVPSRPFGRRRHHIRPPVTLSRMTPSAAQADGLVEPAE